jgi:hypothetical protein
MILHNASATGGEGDREDYVSLSLLQLRAQVAAPVTSGR